MSVGLLLFLCISGVLLFYGVVFVRATFSCIIFFEVYCIVVVNLYIYFYFQIWLICLFLLPVNGIVGL